MIKMLYDPEAEDGVVEAVERLMPPVQEGQEVALRPEVPMAQEIAMVDPVLAQAAAIARLPGLSESMFSRLMEWNEKERAAQAEERFNEAMNAAQAQIVPVARTVQNTQTKSFYAKLESVDAAIRPIYLSHGFSVAYNTVAPLMPGNIRVECEVSLGRHSKKYYREAPADTAGPQGKAVKTVLHGGGSTETYLKRYAVCGAFNVVFRNLDDDGVQGGREYVTDDELAILQKLVEDTDTKLPEFFNLMVSEEVHELNEVSRLDFNRLANALQRKQRMMAQKEEGSKGGEAR